MAAKFSSIPKLGSFRTCSWFGLPLLFSFYQCGKSPAKFRLVGRDTGIWTELEFVSFSRPLLSFAPEGRLRTTHGNDKEADGDEIKRSFVKKGSHSSDKLAKRWSFLSGEQRTKRFHPAPFLFSGRSGKMRALSFKTGIACLCGTEVKEKFQCESLCTRRLVESEGEASRFSKDGERVMGSCIQETVLGLDGSHVPSLSGS